MRSVMLMGTTAVVLTATTLLAVPASAERICRQIATKASADLVVSREVTASTCTTAIEIMAIIIVGRVLNSAGPDLTLTSAVSA